VIFETFASVGATRSSASLRARRQIILSINPFVPKPFTPFQWAPMDSEKSLREKLKIISDGVRGLKGVKFEQKSIKEAILQGVLSQGNRKVGMGLYYHIKENLPLAQAFKKAGVDTEFLAFKEKPRDYLFPWEMVKTEIRKESLFKEYMKGKGVEEGK